MTPVPVTQERVFDFAVGLLWFSSFRQDGQRYEGVFRGGKKEGRGTLAFANGASYEGRFRDDAIDGQGMLQILKPVEDDMGGWMIPIQFQSDIERIHVKAGFDKGGL